MSLHHFFIFFFFSLQDEVSALPGLYYTRLAGENVQIACPSSAASTRKFFCREECKQNDIIIETTKAIHQDGRYSITWRKKRSSSGDVRVTISQLTTADNGRYRCGVDRDSSVLYISIEIIVVDALLTGNRETPIYKRTGGTLNMACFFSSSILFTVRKSFLCRDTCTDALIETDDHTEQAGRYSIRYIEFSDVESVYANISQLTTADSGRYKCGLERLVKDLEWAFEVVVTDDSTTVNQTVPLPTSGPPSWKPQTAPTKPGAESPETTKLPAGTLLYVGLALLVLVVVLFLTLLLLCRRKSSKQNEAHIEMKSRSVMENVPEEHSLSPDENIYYNTVGIRLDRMETDRQNASDDPYTAKVGPSDVTYSELNFPNHTVSSLSSAPYGSSENVIYSSPRRI